MKKSILLVFVMSCWVLFVAGQIPAGYYDAANGKTGEDLQSALHDIINGHTIITYTPGIWSAFYTTDVKPNGTVWDMYSDIPDGTPNGNPPYIYHLGTADQCGSAAQEGDCYSREHSWPKSWFGDIPPMNTDLFHIYPTDQYVNNRRSDNPYGEVGTATWTSENGSLLGDCSTAGYSGTVFEPIDEYKGDLARTYFYMSTRYYTEDAGWPGSDMVDGAQLKTWALNMLKRWSSIDPVSSKETSRNEAVFQLQHNRNPFIDHPEFVYLVWGNPSGISEPERSILTVYPNPVADECFIRIPAGMSNASNRITLLSITGERNVPEQSIDKHKISLNLHGLAKGVYFIQLTDSNNGISYHAKLLKE